MDSSQSTTLRLLVHPPRDGPFNMACDEALLESVGSGESPPTLRFYAWDPPTISLGYFQSVADLQTQSPELRSLAVVRRTTGGGAILHDREVTYSLTLPIHHPWLRPNANRLYEIAHDAVCLAVGSHAAFARDAARADRPQSSSQRGPFFCFARRHALDVVLNAARDPAQPKLAGSAQRRTRTSVLQHGSIILRSRFPQQPCATWSSIDGTVDVPTAVELLRRAFESTLRVRLTEDDLRPAERARAESLRAKYSDPAWTNRR